MASRESGTSLMGLESGGLGKIIKRLTYVCERLSEVKQAARQLDAIKTGTLSGGSNGMAIAPTKRLLARSNLGAERAKRHGGARDKSESPHSTFVDKQPVGRHSEAVHFGPTEASRVLSSISAKGSTAAGLSAHLRAGRPEAQQSASVQPTVAGSRATRFSGNSNKKGDPFIINFSPTVVIQSHAEIIDFENSFVEAMTRHSYELVRLINRELQIQGRAAF